MEIAICEYCNKKTMTNVVKYGRYVTTLIILCEQCEVRLGDNITK